MYAAKRITIIYTQIELALISAGGAAALSLILLEQPGQTVQNILSFEPEVVRFARIVGQIEQLDERCLSEFLV